MITHVFHRATVARIVKETADARTFVLAPHEQPFRYRAGQYVTFRVNVGGEELYRSYSMSSAPETDAELATTVKRVPGGKVSNWMLDNLTEGDEVTITRAAGTFCLDSVSAPLLGFAGGSGVTPVLSLTKSALATTDRRVRLLCADRDRASVIFDAALSELVDRYRSRLQVVRHIDAERGLIDPATVTQFVGDDRDADCYLCGPAGFMAVVKSALPGPGRVFVENFDTVPQAPAEAHRAQPRPSERAGITIRLGRKKVSVPRVPNETLLESARRTGLTPPFSCEAGNCGTCMARLTDGHATMRVNDALTDDEVADGYVLTCQAVPDTDSVTVHYED
ncbi:MAG: ferredoxin--NADP reductase [Mycobacteriaceae bacterium]|nr:ferredoxin--NADP reductase [Mycobacteriaceae bacterium]MBV9638110.1 ferredoxin--NADP reductase [Mycobacteriaceae bacterium]